MKTAVQSSCPLCGKASLRPNLHARNNSEHETIRQATIEVIQSSHPAWIPKDGMCERCWISYRDIVRVVNFFKEFRDRNLRSDSRALRILSVAADEKNLAGRRQNPTPMRRHGKMMIAGGGGG